MRRLPLLLLLFAPAAFAQFGPMDKGMQVKTNPNGTKTYFFPSPYLGQPGEVVHRPTPITPTTPIPNSANYGGLTIDAAPSGGGARVTGQFNTPFPGGVEVPTTATSGISRAVLAGAAARLIGGPAGMAVGMALPELMKWYSDNQITPGPDGSLPTKPPTSGCVGMPCYRTQTSPASYHNSTLEACKADFALRPLAWRDAFKNFGPIMVTPYACTWGAPNIYSSSWGGWVTIPLSEYNALPPALRTPISPFDVENALSVGVGPSPAAVRDLLSLDASLDTESVRLSGPTSVPGPGVPIVQTKLPGPAIAATATSPALNGVPGEVTTTTTTYDVGYQGSSVSISPVQTTVTQSGPPYMSPIGTPSPPPTTTVTKGGETTITCGLPGTPACSINENGTPAALASSAYSSVLDAPVLAAAAARATIAGVADKSFFSGWSSFFAAPAVVACRPFVLPRDYGSLDPCPVVDGVRLVMSYIWALGAFVLCLGMVKRTF